MNNENNFYAIIVKKLNITDMESLERRTLRKVKEFNKKFNPTNTYMSKVDYKIINDYVLIKSEQVRSDAINFQHTKLFNLKEGNVIFISGLSTLNIDEVPLYMINF